jgi:hypothetical protein
MPATPPARREPALVIGSMRITGWRFQVMQIVFFGAVGALVATRLTQSAHKAGW